MPLSNFGTFESFPNRKISNNSKKMAFHHTENLNHLPSGHTPCPGLPNSYLLLACTSSCLSPKSKRHTPSGFIQVCAPKSTSQTGLALPKWHPPCHSLPPHPAFACFFDILHCQKACVCCPSALSQWSADLCLSPLRSPKPTTAVP